MFNVLTNDVPVSTSLLFVISVIEETEQGCNHAENAL